MFAACDEKYFDTHGRGFIYSAISAGHRVHVIISPEPGPALERRAAELQSRVDQNFVKALSLSQQKHLTLEVVADGRAKAAMSPLERKVFYQSLRFYHLPRLLRSKGSAIAVLDIDSLVRKPIPYNGEADVGLYFRLDNTNNWSEEAHLGTKVLAALIYATPCAADYFDKVAAYLDRNERRYFIDQRALYETYLQEPGERFFDLAKTGWLDWTFKEESPVWTAKGRLLRRELRYIRERLKYERAGRYRRFFVLAGYRLGILRK
ncbi:hypothetical protein HED50_06965 [Ochrobactrum oryzae]|uniref:Uncharacterized protein n=1 Tax=Brucella oryzae TaxID=335286 RepID=A0A2S7IUX6_9HYPH|nr:hypothetical protein [Brucella oryzae]NKC22226.1 hypothetical protein [Brucella oryzae]PQA71813.1 hypothetical protein C3731_19990 [Brucella oryzae]